jgi:hypothetical protein
MTNFITTNRYVALVILFIGLLTYGSTVAPTVSYWDCGEYIAAAATFGIPHPAGAPLFIIIGRVAAILAVTPEDVAYAINMLSALSSAFSIMFMYLSLMMMFESWKGKVADLSTFVVRSSSAVIATLCFAFSHTFWFSAVETEMYAHVMLFVTLVLYLMLRWSFVHEEEGSDRYLLLIAYILGLSLGVHILTILIIPALTIIYFNTKKESVNNKMSVAYLFLGNLIVLIIYPGIIKYYPQMIRALGDISWGFIIILALLALSYYFYKQKKRGVFLFIASLFLVTLGYTSYFSVYVRSGLDPIIDENNPETLESFISYINREQYGGDGVFPRKWSVKGQRSGKIWVGDGTGIAHRFPDGTVKKIRSISELGNSAKPFEHFGAQLQFLINYQYRHMFMRYIAWNYIGTPDGEAQDAEADFSKLWGLPLLFSLAGAVYLYFNDRKTFWLSTGIFLMFGFVFYLMVVNPNEPQPRERDYSSVVSFFAMALWICYGVYACIEKIREMLSNSPAISYAALGILFLALPMRMLAVNYESHDRSGNTVAWDYSYNILQSCDENAILFTNGDNDTFPIWYLQTVEGVRPDVTAVNLSLLNTPWYIKQQKNGQLGTPPPISFSDSYIDKNFKQPSRWKKQKVSIPVPSTVLEKVQGEYQNFKSKTFNAPSEKSAITFELEPQMQYPTAQGSIGFLRVQDWIALNIITENNWERPLNWAVTVGGGNLLGGLRNFMRMDGLVYKLTPIEGWSIDPVKLENLISNSYKYRALKNKDVYLNDNVKGLIQNIRSAYIQLAQHYGANGQAEKQREVFRKMNENIDPEVIPINNRNLELLIDVMTKFSSVDSVSNADFELYTIAELNFIWRTSIQYPNTKLRDGALLALIDRYPVTSNDRKQAIAYLLNLNQSNKPAKENYKKRFISEYEKIDKSFTNQLKAL